jgi:hypothetical protein
LNPEWLIVAPDFDEVTKYTLDEAMDVIDYLKEKNVEYISLLDADAIKEKAEAILAEYPNCNFGHWNHGSPDAVWGDDDRPVIDLSNVGVLKGRDCYNSNCSSAKRLGVEVWKLGGIFFGYTDLVSFTTDAAEEFKEAFNYGIKRRIDGFSWKECLERTKARMTELADALVEAGKVLAGACMRQDRDILVCYTADNPPKPDTTWCPFRKLAVKISNGAGWFISRRLAVGIILQWSGFSLMVHDYFEACELIDNPFAIQGFWFGLVFAVSGFLLITSDTVKWIKKQVKMMRK